MLPSSSALLIFGFLVLGMAVAVACLGGAWWAWLQTGSEAEANRALIRGGLLLVGWLVATLVLAASGVLRQFDRRPPPLAIFLAIVLVGATWIACSRVGLRLARGLTFTALVGMQAFRWPLELLMHRAAAEGVMPVQMSYSGRNFDIVTGITAALLALTLARRPVPRAVVAAWNVLGAALLANILVVALISTPFFAAFGPDRLNTWIAYPPFVWLPALMVPVALAGHIVIFRKLALG
jgi:hypothetical protein